VGPATRATAPVLAQVVLPSFINIRCFSFVKQIYLYTFYCVYIRVNLHTKRYLDTFASQTLNILYFKTEGVPLYILRKFQKNSMA
jgi:hypothetical protein